MNTSGMTELLVIILLAVFFRGSNGCYCNGIGDAPVGQTVTIRFYPDSISGYGGINIQAGCSFSSEYGTLFRVTCSQPTQGQTVTATQSNGVVCTDSSCTQAFNFYKPILATGSANDINCPHDGDNGQIAVNVYDGPGAPYTFTWTQTVTNNPSPSSDTVTGLAAGTYDLSITAPGATPPPPAAVYHYTVHRPGVLSATSAITPVSCLGDSDGAVTVTPSGGTGQKYITWLDGDPSGYTRTQLTSGAYAYSLTDDNGCTSSILTATVGSPIALSVAATFTPPTCHGYTDGTATATATGGTPSYSYTWDISNNGNQATITVGAGTYNVDAIDSHTCGPATDSTTVTEPAALTATFVQTNPMCHGASTGAITATVSGGNGAYTYAWTRGSTSVGSTAAVSGLIAGTYGLTYTDGNSCPSTPLTVVLTEPPALQITTPTQQDVLCRGGSTGSATITVMGGTGSYAYSWTGSSSTSATAAGLAAGSYTVTVTDGNNCVATHTFTITQPAAALSAVSQSQSNVLCYGSTGSATVLASGGSPTYSYSWDHSISSTTATATGLLAGTTYTVTVTDSHQCQTTFPFSITGPTAPITIVPTQVNVGCYGGATGSATATVSGGVGSYTYSWGTMSLGTSNSITSVPAGTYTVTVTDSNACLGTHTFTLTQAVAYSDVTLVQTNVVCFAGLGSATVTPVGGTSPFTYSWTPAVSQTGSLTGVPAGIYAVTITDSCSVSKSKTVVITQNDALVLTPSQVNVACNGESSGSASVIAQGGSRSYTYAWSPSGGTGPTASGLAAGNYALTVTDSSGCANTINFVITQPTVLAVTPTITPVTCPGGSDGAISLATVGGTNRYVVQWNPTSAGSGTSVTRLKAGDYVAIVSDSNYCSQSHTYTVAEPTALSISITSVQINCNGGSTGSATATASGGSGSYTYAWSPSGGSAATATGLASGTYTVTVTDAHGCILTKSVTITERASLVITPSQTNVQCRGASTGAASAAVAGGSGAYTYSWSSGQSTATLTGITAGSYTLTVTDANSCTAVHQYTITEPGAALSATPSQVNVMCRGQTGSATVQAAGGTASYTYLWSPGALTTATASNIVAGSYSVTITDAHGCTVQQPFTITEPTQLTTTGTQVNVACNGGSSGSATVTASGGAQGYTYSWSPSGQTGATATSLSVGTYVVTVTDANGCTATRSFTITQPTQLTATGTQVNVACNGGSSGSATVTASGGTQGYTYSWSPSGQTGATATGLSAGTHVVTVTDSKGCTVTKSFTITEPTQLTSTGTQVNVACNGGTSGSATVTASGGTQGYTYSWSSGQTAATATGLAAGTHVVTVTDAKGCTITRSFTITEPTQLTTTGTQINVACNGGTSGSATVTASGGTQGYTYSWGGTSQTTATATTLSAGTYVVTVTDTKACTATRSFTITEPTPLTSSGTQVNVACNGGTSGSATVTASGGTQGYTYSWSPSSQTAATATGLSVGAHTATVTDSNGCTVIQFFNVTQPNPLVVVTNRTNVGCSGGNNGYAQVIPSGGAPTYTYAWSNGDTSSSTSNLVAGQYYVVVKDANQCTQNVSVPITQPSAPLSVFTAQVNVSCFGGRSGNIVLMPSGGTPLYTYAWSNNRTTPTISGLYAGQYSVVVNDANRCSKTLTFTIPEPAPMQVVFNTTNPVCYGGTNGQAQISVSGGTPGYTYVWSNGQTASNATNFGAGKQFAIVTDAKQCQLISYFNITAPSLYCVRGTCVGFQQCSCPAGWSGPTCAIPACSSPCLNGGNCTASFTCTCPTAWTGPTCSINATTTKATYVVEATQYYSLSASVSPARYTSMLAAILDIPASNMQSQTSITSTLPKTRDTTVLYAKLDITIYFNNTGTSLNKTEELVIQAANSTVIRKYLEDSGSDPSMNYLAIQRVELETINVETPAPVEEEKSNDRSRRLGLGLGLGLALPVTAAAAGGVLYTTKFKHKRVEKPAEATQTRGNPIAEGGVSASTSV